MIYSAEATRVRCFHLWLWALAVLLVGCGSDPPAESTPLGAAQLAVAIPGPWTPPPSTQAIAATQFVPVVDPPSVSPAGSCSSTNPFACSCTHPACTPGHPGTVELRDYLLAHFPGITNSGTYCCRQNSNNLSKLSVHAIGRALDLGVAEIGGDADNTVGDAVANWLVEHAEYIGIQRVIWDYAFWNGENGFGLLGGDPHTNHLHIELSVDGAAKQTPFFTSGAPGEVCTPECAGTVLIGEDCSSIDCAGDGAECLVGPPPHCGEPLPPEPPEAVYVPGSTFPSLSPVGAPGRLAFSEPVRLFDTRSSMDGLTWDDATNELTWASGLPASVEGLWLNLAAVATTPGYITAFSTGSSRPDTSNINTSGRVRANLIPARLGASQSVSFYQSSPVELIGDAYATMSPDGDGLELVDPVRVYDSRSVELPLRADETTVVDVGPPAGATGVLASVAALRPPADGFLTVFPCGEDLPTSTVNLAADEIASNQVVSALGADGTICLRPSQDMDGVFDVLGFFSSEGMLEYQAVTPVRLVDTRNGVYYENRLAAHQTIELPLATAVGMPENGWAAVFNIATVEADGDGYLTVFACERGTAPGTSAHNFSSDVRATLVTSDLASSGAACVVTSTRTHIIVDLLGLWRRTDGTPPPDPETTEEPTDPIGPDGGGVGRGVAGSNEGGGCSIVLRSSSSQYGGFTLLALVALVRRRKRLS